MAIDRSTGGMSAALACTRSMSRPASRYNQNSLIVPDAAAAGIDPFSG